MRSYIFTDQERRRLRQWLDTGEEDQETRNIFLRIRTNLMDIREDVNLLVEATERLRVRGRMVGRTRLTNKEPVSFDEPA